MKLGTHIKLPDGRVGTAVFNGLVGVGIKWGLHYPSPEELKGTHGDLFDSPELPEDWPWEPDALLRKPWSDTNAGWSVEQCVGEEYEVTYVPVQEESQP